MALLILLASETSRIPGGELYSEVVTPYLPEWRAVSLTLQGDRLLTQRSQPIPFCWSTSFHKFHKSKYD